MLIVLLLAMLIGTADTGAIHADTDMHEPIGVYLPGVSAVPPFTARWDGPGRATLRWSQSAHSCVYRESAIGERAFVGCFDGSGRAALVLGGPQTDGAYRPTAGDVFVLDGPEGVRRAQLRSVGYLAVWRG